MTLENGGESVTFDGEMLGKMLGAFGVRLRGAECNRQDIVELYKNIGRCKVLFSGCVMVVYDPSSNSIYAVSCGKDECICVKFENVKMEVEEK